MKWYETNLYSRWYDMLRRCYDPNRPDYKYYGARGIKVCIGWRKNGRLFRKWALQNGYEPHLELDRINNNDHYYPDNCRWVTHSLNCMNVRSLGKIKYLGVSYHTYHDKYQAHLRINSILKHIGYFKSAWAAAVARDRYIKKHKLPHKLNFNW